MSNTVNNEKFKLLHKPPKGKMGGLLIVFIWIAIWNIIYQFVHDAWHDMPIVNWAFFISVTIFFMQEELTYKQRFWHTLVGGAVGLLLAAGVSILARQLMGFGLSHAIAVSIPLLVVIAMLILLHPYLPLFFNNVGFCYLIIAFIESGKIVEQLPNYLLSLLLGSICLNLGCSVLIGFYTKQRKKKAMAAAQAQTAAK